MVSLDVVDNGTGFDMRKLDEDRSESFGITAMRRRVQQFDGSLAVESEPGHTAVTATFPIHELAVAVAVP